MKNALNKSENIASQKKNCYNLITVSIKECYFLLIKSFLFHSLKSRSYKNGIIINRESGLIKCNKERKYGQFDCNFELI